MASKVDQQKDSTLTPDEVESVEIECGNDGKKRKRKERSIVWTYFEKLTQNSIDGKKQCKCKKCKNIFKYDSKFGTGNLKRHLDSCYGSQYHDVGQMLFNSDMALRSSKFDENKFREMLVKAIIMHELPLSFVDYKGMRDLFTYMQPNVSIVSRNTVKSDLLSLFKREKEKLKTMLMESPGMLSLTSDLWTSIATDGYLAITVHFVDKQWVLQKRVLSFSFMPSPHTGVAICEKVLSLLVDWGIETKIFCVTLDNASSNDSFAGMLRERLHTKSPLVSCGKFFHLRCCAHILNLVVQDGLKEIDESVQKIRESVKYVKGSQARKQKFMDCVKLLSLNEKRGLRQDVPTRWNSTFSMLDSAIYYRRAFCHLELSDSNFKSCPSALEWDRVEKISSFPSAFNDVTNVFSGTNYPTANLYYPNIFMAYLTLVERMKSKDGYMKKMAALMMIKFEKYWSEFSLTLAIAVVFDPRYKLKFIKWSYIKIYGEENPQYEEVKALLHSTFNEYVGNCSFTNLSDSTTSKATEDLDEDMTNSTQARLKDFDDFQCEDHTTTKKSELDLYLEESRVARNSKVDVLAFWKANEFRYPTLAHMARDFLTIPISTVASESTFSASGRVLDQYRSSLSKDTVEALICTKDWLFADCGSNEISVSELTEDIMMLNLEQESGASNSATNSKV